MNAGQLIAKLKKFAPEVEVRFTNPRILDANIDQFEEWFPLVETVESVSDDEGLTVLLGLGDQWYLTDEEVKQIGADILTATTE